MVVLTAQYQCKTGMGDQVETALLEMMKLVKDNEPGCVHYLANRGQADKDAFLLFEQYQDESALAQHSETAYFQRLVLGTIVPLLEKRERTLYSAIQPK
ncbi:putative quinol monooxygenase [Alicyclobacillus sp. ALC3]|uniref:putative quinol monooxygenase n=1 Tax=Alicyclobacillus sp. ALC3 TaxID=2796143 RepID=UPI0023798220|nr:antibiotic biosynthesis monooxygenase family protein [Alicyclobacillus sp. ALC3]WDL96239.1 antibiotic biosynthesis monooxygenase [Alicyclobacillus sp. ALC3]